MAAEISADANGRYRLFVPPGEIRVQCMGTPNRYYPALRGEKQVTVPAGEHVKDVDFKVHGAPAIEGEALMGDGHKAPEGLDVWVLVSWRDTRAKLSYGGMGYDAATVSRLRTNADGRFIAYLRSPQGPSAEYQALDSIVALVRSGDGLMGGSSSIKAPDGDKPAGRMKIVLEKTGSATLSIVGPEGEAVAEANITVLPPSPWYYDPGAGPRFTFASLGNGRYRVDGLIAGVPNRFQVEAAGYRDRYPGDRKPSVAKAGENVEVPTIKVELWGKKAVPALMKYAAVNQGALWDLGNIGPEAAEAAPTLEGVLKDSLDREKRRLAAQALGKIGPAAASAVPTLLQALENDTPEVARYAAEALGLIGDAKAAGPIQEALKAGKIDAHTANAALWRLKRPAELPSGAATQPATAPATRAAQP